MNRERVAWAVSVVAIAFLAFQIPGSLAQRDDDYAFVRTLVDIHRQVANNYVEPVDEDKLRQGAIDGMLGQLDPFSMYVPPVRQEEFDRLLEGTFKGVGIQLDQDEKTGDVQVVSPLEGSPAFRAGVLAGDVIFKVNGEDIKGLRLPEVVKKIAGPLGTEVALTVRHASGEEVQLKMVREEIVVPTVKGYQRKPDNSWDYYVCNDPRIAYLRITQFTGETFDKLKPIMQGLLNDGMKGFILDLRFNPGGRLDQAKEVVDLFLKDGIIVSVKGRNRPEDISYAHADGTLPDFPMAVLINEHSASASEIVAGSLKDNHRALVVGARSYGKGSVQEVVPLEGKSGELKITVAYYYLPSGRLVHRKKDATDWGVEPQINVPMDADAQRRVVLQQFEQELLRRPMPKVATRQTTTAAATQPTTRPTDVQLDAAVSTMVGYVVLQGERRLVASQPMTRPAE